MSAITLGRGKTIGLVAAAAVALSMVPVGGAQAAPSECTIESYSPTKIIVGATKVNLTITPKITGCEVAGWAFATAAFPQRPEGDLTYIPTSDDPTITVTPRDLANADAGRKAAFVFASGTNDTEDDTQAELDSTFSLLRRSTFGSTFNASPEPAEKGTKITIKGTLARINLNGAKTLKYVGFPKAKVKVQFKAAGTTTFKTIKTVTAGAGGKVSTTVPAVKSGYWRLSFAGVSTTAAANSAADGVVVRAK
jgi:hypothetical protein